ncbi:secreted protein [gut metagenome]|uniref:Secreted protein n=1 Tax=gut metagenome TaxID=749906 RepID=J9FCR4_9ZZZZ
MKRRLLIIMVISVGVVKGAVLVKAISRVIGRYYVRVAYDLVKVEKPPIKMVPIHCG